MAQMKTFNRPDVRMDWGCGTKSRRTPIRASKTTKRKLGQTTKLGATQTVRMSPPQLSAVDAWARAEDERMSRPEAIRRLVELGLSIKNADRDLMRDDQRARASELAGGEIDKLTDQRATSDDQASRKRQLIKGPEEFRASRVDRKAKN
jgi:hypothetical protein